MSETTGEVQSRAAELPDISVPWGLPIGLVAVAGAFTIYIVGSIILISVVLVFDPHVSGSHDLEITAFSYQFLVLGVAAMSFWLVRARHRLSLSQLGIRFPGWGRLAAAAAAVIPLLLGVAIMSFLFETFVPGFKLQGNAQVIFPTSETHVALVEKILLFLFVAVEVPLTEEVLFRGILYQGARTFFLRHFSIGISVASGALVSGSVFGLLHLSDPRELHTLPTLILLGVALAYVFHYSRSVFGSALVHGIVNGLAIITVFGQ
jgi:membrane protease YdiL (CAAX protease family)